MCCAMLKLLFCFLSTNFTNGKCSTCKVRIREMEKQASTSSTIILMTYAQRMVFAWLSNNENWNQGSSKLNTRLVTVVAALTTANQFAIDVTKIALNLICLMVREHRRVQHDVVTTQR